MTPCDGYPQWEYKRVAYGTVLPAETLDAYGREGWELVDICRTQPDTRVCYVHVLKRPRTADAADVIELLVRAGRALQRRQAEEQ